MDLARGHRQREARRLASHPPRPSALAGYLTEKWSWGLLPATEVQKLAALAVQDHADSPEELLALVELGSAGTNPSHCHQDMCRRMKLSSGLSEAYSFSLTMRNPKRHVAALESASMNLQTSMVPPFVFFHELYKLWPAEFADRMLGTDDLADAHSVLARFWADIPSHDPRRRALKSYYLDNGLVRSEAELWSCAIPISLHGDSVPAADMSLETLSWASELGHHRSTLDQKVLISSLVNKTLADGTKQQFWSSIFWASCHC